MGTRIRQALPVGIAAVAGLAVFAIGFLAMSCGDTAGPPSETSNRPLDRKASPAAKARSGSSAGSGASARGRFKAQLAQVRRATAKYHRLATARSQGFVQFSVFVPGMGFHFVDGHLITGRKTFDWGRVGAFGSARHRKNPPLLVYGRRANGKKKRLVAVEYAVPVSEPIPGNLFAGNRDDRAWHVHPSVHELVPPARSRFRRIEGACHYPGGLELLLAVTAGGAKVVIVPPTGQRFGAASWSTATPGACPSPGPAGLPLLAMHKPVHTLHVWLWHDNPEGLFHPTNPRIGH